MSRSRARRGPQVMRASSIGSPAFVLLAALAALAAGVRCGDIGAAMQSVADKIISLM